LEGTERSLIDYISNRLNICYSSKLQPYEFHHSPILL
jgi:hypothetical protein